MTTAPTSVIDRPRQMAWLDWIKAIAIVWIFINHLAERIFGFPYIANPNANWPSLAERVDQLRPLAGSGIWDVPLNLFRYVGWFGDQGVQLFLIASGFGLTWGLLARGEGTLAMGRFFRRRAGRIYPIWWGAHAIFIATWIITGWGISLLDRALLPSLIGLRITPGLFYYFCPAWWFIGLILQLYLVYPLLWNTLRSRGPAWTLLVWGGVALLIRGLGLHFFEGYLDVWQRGGIFITRLPEFVFGMALAAGLHQDRERTDRWLRSPSVIGVAVLAYALALVLSLFRLGMTVAPLLQGASLFVLLYDVWRGRPRTDGGVMPWIARHSYSLYLMHFVFILLLLPQGASTLRVALPGTVLAIVLTVVVALGLERMVAFMWTDAGPLRRVLAPIGLGIVVVGLALGGELLVRRHDPQEVFGWGERASLEPHPSFGWRLAPSKTTRLRWEGYDYTVTANSLGFAGPEYAAERTPGTLRILTVGDAFTSAEGVDTDAAWPRLLESDLDQRLPDRSVEVLNFAITGHGPQQYASVVEHFGPIYQPDLIVVGFFVNEYQDVLATNEDFCSSIGFGRPPRRAGDPWWDGCTWNVSYSFGCSSPAVRSCGDDRVLTATSWATSPPSSGGGRILMRDAPG